MDLKEELLQNPEFKKIYDEKGIYDYHSSERINILFVKEFLNLYERVTLLEKEYIANPQKRKEIYKELIEKLAQLSFVSKELNNHIIEKFNNWQNSPLSSNTIIEINNSTLLLKIILALANMINNDYDLKKINVTEYIRINDKEVTPNFCSIMILSNKKILSILDDRRNYHSIEIYKFIKKLLEKGYPIIYTTDLSSQHNRIKTTEKFYVQYSNDLMCNINHDSILNSSIEKLVAYISKYGSDLTGIPFDTLIEDISKEEPTKKRKLSTSKYIEYNK